MELYHASKQIVQYPEVRKAKYTKEAQKYYNGKIFVPQDLEEIEI